MMLRQYIEIEPTSRCNLQCEYCLPISSRVKAKHYDMSLELFSVLLKQIKDFVPMLMFKGLGEPLLHEQLHTMIELANEQGFWTFVSTNFSLPKITTLRRAHGALVSLDAVSDGPWNLRKGVDPKLVRKHIEQLSYSRGNLESLHVFTVVHKANVDHLEQVLQYIDDIKDLIDWTFIGPVLNITQPDLMLNQYELQKTKELLEKYSHLRLVGPLLHEPPKDCGWLSHLFYITAQGKLAICSVREPVLQERFSSILEVPLQEQLRSPQLQEFRATLANFQLDDICQHCYKSGMTGCFHAF